MNYSEIEKLKSIITNLMQRGSRLKVPAHNVDGKIIGVGFKPYWTNPTDSKIEKLEINFMDSYGRIIPFNFYNITRYSVISHDDQRLENSQNVSLDIHLFAPHKVRDEEPYEKIRVDIVSEQNK